MMKRVLILVCATTSVLRLVAQEQTSLPMPTMTFDEALAVAFESNATVQAAKFGVKASEQERRAAIGLRLPTIGVSANYTWMGDDMAVDLNGAKNGVVDGVESLLPSLDPVLGGMLQGLIAPLAEQDWRLVLQKRSFASVGATVSLPIFTGGRINVANRAARIGEKIADSELSEVRSGLTAQLVERYFGLQLAQHAVEVRRQVAEGIKQHLADAVALERNGVIAPSERLYAEYKSAEAERDLQRAQLTVHTAQEALSNTLGGAEVMPVTAMFVLEYPEDVGYFCQLALSKSLVLQQVKLQEGLAHENLRLQRADFFPQVAAMGAASLYNWQVSNILPRWAVGVGANFKIFDGLTREYRYSAAKQTLRSVESLVAKAESDIVLLVESLHAQMMSRLALLRSLESSITFAQEYLRSKRAAFAQGMSSSSDVIDAELNYAKARIERLEAAYEFDMALARLLEASGVGEEFADYIKRTDVCVITF